MVQNNWKNTDLRERVYLNSLKKKELSQVELDKKAAAYIKSLKKAIAPCLTESSITQIERAIEDLDSKRNVIVGDIVRIGIHIAEGGTKDCDPQIKSIEAPQIKLQVKTPEKEEEKKEEPQEGTNLKSKAKKPDIKKKGKEKAPPTVEIAQNKLNEKYEETRAVGNQAGVTKENRPEAKPGVWTRVKQTFSKGQASRAIERIRKEVVSIETKTKDIQAQQKDYITKKKRKLEAYKRLMRMRNYKQGKGTVALTPAQKNLFAKFGEKFKGAFAKQEQDKKRSGSNLLRRLKARKRLMRMNRKKAARNKLPFLRGVREAPQANMNRGAQAKMSVLRRGVLREDNRRRLAKAVKMTPRIDIKANQTVKNGKTVRVNPQAKGGKTVSMAAMGAARGSRCA